MLRNESRTRGFTVIEFVVASALTLALLTTVTVASSSLQKSLIKNQLKAELAIRASNIFEQARAFGCGASVNPEPSTELGGDTSAKATACRDIITEGTTPVVRGDYTWTFTPTSTNTSVKAAFSTLWRQSAISGPDCYVETVRDGRLIQPSTLVRRIDFSWQVFGTSYTASFENAESFPAVREIFNDGLGALAVDIPAATSALTPPRVVLRKNGSAAGSIERTVQPCKPTGSSSPTAPITVLFPYLPAGTYSVTLETGSSSGASQVKQSDVEPNKLAVLPW